MQNYRQHGQARSSQMNSCEKIRVARRGFSSEIQARRFRRLLVESLEARWVLSSEWLALIEANIDFVEDEFDLIR